jgi:outer membrane protein TolC
LEVLHRRPDVARSLARVEAADRRVAAAVADRLPRLGLSAGISSTAPEIDDVFSDWLASLAANLAGPVIDGGARRAEVARAEAVRSEAINTYRQTMLDAFAETENALAQEQRQRALLESLDRQAGLARQITESLRDRFLGGNEDFLRILTAEVNRQALDRQRLAAHRQLIDYRIGLYRALAGGFPLERPAPANLNEE